MENKKKQNLEEEEQYFSLRDFLTQCLAKWSWFVASFIIFVGFGYFYTAKQEPVYRRTLSVLVKDQSAGGAAEISNAFASMGLVSSNTNVNNELLTVTSPSIMAEVVTRLKLVYNYNKEGGMHPTTLYGTNNPVETTMPDMDPELACGYVAEIQPNGSAVLKDFWKVSADGKVEKIEKEVKARLGFDMIKTPIGRITLQPNGTFAGQIKEPIKLNISRDGLSNAIADYATRLKGDLADRDAEVIDLTIEDVSIERATTILNTVIEVYNENWVSDKNKMAIATSDFISERLDVIQRELGSVDDEISDFKARHKVPDIEMTVGNTLKKSEQMDMELILANNELAMTEYVRDYMQNPKNAGKVIPANVGLKDTYINQAVASYNTMLLQYQSLAANSSSSNPMIKDMENQLHTQREAVYTALVSSIGAQKANVASLNRAIGNTDSELSTAPTQAKQLLSIERQQKVKEELYLYLLQKREENELSQTFTAYNTRIITPPYGPLAPVAPKKGLILVICAFLGLGIPAVVLYLIEATNTKVRSRKDLDSLQVPFAGEIPMIGRRRWWKQLLKSRKKRLAEKEAPKPVVVEGKRDVPNEAFRVVRSNIDFMIGKDKGCSVIMLTSFNPGSGKSFIAYNLGASFSLKNKRVLLIDGDLRHGSLSMYAGSPKKGLSTYLTEHTDDWRKLVVHVDAAHGIDILPIGHRPPNPAELLDNGRIGTLIQEARADYDVIIIDCPPVNIVVDTQIIEEYADRTIFVVRSGLLERSAVPEIAQLYEDNKLRHMSVLLNGTKSEFSTYYHYGNYEAFNKDED